MHPLWGPTFSVSSGDHNNDKTWLKETRRKLNVTKSKSTKSDDGKQMRNRKVEKANKINEKTMAEMGTPRRLFFHLP
jgi:hypothetical protein